ncbi:MULTISPECIES: MmgE/PrpD family protein [unclassified Bradyrhizobium]|uniref:MmgE/PrpD family protein n=1 Tax=unclassified Bradyrhizobium TaxID=2631580 RepID=UPI002112D9CC|nr:MULTISPECIES: MmgE/PrpD family protein [unclassified Bradyrhizobium]
MDGHASAMLVPPLLALGEHLGSSGRDLALAYVVGFETACRIGRGVNHHHYDKGWHPTATLGIFGTVAAAARLLNLTVDQTAAALGLSASLACGLKSNFGTMTKSLHVGHAARSGLFAALMVREGFTANPAAFEHKQGFLDVFNGPSNYDTSRMLGDWYAPFECDSSSLKPYPCCGSIHSTIECVIEMAKQYDLHAENVAKLEVILNRRRLPHTDNADPQTPLAAKFSQQYCAARALVSRSVKLEHFEGNASSDPVVRALLQRTTALPHPEWGDDPRLQMAVEVLVTMNDGQRVVSRIDDYKRFGPGSRTLPREAMWEKFEDCAKRSLPSAQIAPLFEQLEQIDQVENLTETTRLMQTPNVR